MDRKRQSLCTTAPRTKYADGTHPFTVCIEGNIGSGKTTFLNHFEKYEKDICLLTEPVEKWRNLQGSNLLDLMYKDPKLWAMPFQSYVTLTMLQSHILETDKPVKLMERSIFSARNCFISNMLKTGVLPDGMFQVLESWFEFIMSTMNIQVDLIVYLRTSPEVVYERIRQRARSEESCVPIQYLRQLHELHEDWLIHNRSSDDTKVLVLDANLGLDEIGREYERSEVMISAPLFQPTTPPPILVSPSKHRRC